MQLVTHKLLTPQWNAEVNEASVEFVVVLHSCTHELVFDIETLEISNNFTSTQLFQNFLYA